MDFCQFLNNEVTAMRSLSNLIKLSAGLAIIALPGIAISAPADGQFRPDLPFGLEDLPPGRTRDKIGTLPLAAQERAVAWLNSFSFHESDLAYIKVDDEGGVFYQDTVMPDTTHEATETSSSEGGTPALEAATNVFALHSKPGASKVFILDFDGHVISGTAWNSGAEASYSATPFDTDGNFNNVSDAERAAIHEIWHRIAEDFAPFDIDITTEEPASLTSTTGRLLITRNTDINGQDMPYMNSGGVAYVGVWGRSNFTSYYSPALVYYNKLSSMANYIAEAASHEAGHNLNLSHDGQGSTTYYTGHGAGYVSWAPVMGVGYYNNVTQWSNGEYSGATQTQDDMAIIASQLAYRSDDHSASNSTATELVIAADGSIDVSNPETDPANTIPANKGIIETRSDIDTFTFIAGAGSVDISAIPAWDAFYRSSRRGANLDIELTLSDDSGVIATSDPSDNTDARIVQNLPAGRYYLEVNGVGSSTSPYSDYGSLGQYFITGTVAPSGETSDITAPSPNPMGWTSVPNATGSTNSIAMTALTANDDSGFVEYQFTCVAGGSGCISSAWQTSSSYVASNLSAGTAYSYQVTARDLYNNLTIASTSATATTAANNAPSAGNDSANGNEDSVITVDALANDSDPDGQSLSVSAVGNASNGSTSTDGSTITYTPNADFSGSDSFTYTVSDGAGASATATVSVSVNPVNDAPSAVNDSASVSTNSSVTIDVLANDSDKEGSALSLVSVGSANKGSITISGSSVIYTAGKKRGNDTVTYTVSDGDKQSTASISISIGGGGGGSTDDGGSGSGKCHPKKGC
ncbi:hypothetical protein A9Q90_03620 [Gammaproteobacteria bacterium 54_18_T64]|nr:hypothetical protein A9Q90_03620 [Gammaproteobacteria bacterium 54_18_T64]